jgi:hypothetical protein
MTNAKKDDASEDVEPVASALEAQEAPIMSVSICSVTQQARGLRGVQSQGHA